MSTELIIRGRGVRKPCGELYLVSPVNDDGKEFLLVRVDDDERPDWWLEVHIPVAVMREMLARQPEKIEVDKV